ncbi:MAG TPA: hypothetical protein VHP37_13110 [Burkholderiales bacterium]|nr:hypothetical protein [Burkholderiales bacterium]
MLAVACAACLTACEAPSPTMPSAIVTPMRPAQVSPGRAQNAVVPGKSTRAEVAAALGDTLAITFDNGYEVWVYRLGSARAGEFVVLFEPSGIVAKTRQRP